MMSAIVLLPLVPGAAVKCQLSASTVHLVHQDRAPSFSIEGLVQSWIGRAKAQLTTNNLRILEVPRVITDCTPLAPVIHLQASIGGLGTFSKTQRTIFEGCKRGCMLD